MTDRPPLGRRLLGLLTGLVAVAALLAAGVSWVALSRPFDPPQLAALTVDAPPDPPNLPGYPGAITVLTYHGVSDTDASATTLSRRTFAEHLATLAAAGYRTVRLSEVRDALAGGASRLPERPLLLTFDDGSLTTWTTVDPVLRAYGFTAVAFLTTGRIVAPGTPSAFLSTRQVRDMADSGRWEFGSHTDALHDWVPVAGDIQPALTNQILVDAGRRRWTSGAAGWVRTWNAASSSSCGCWGIGSTRSPTPTARPAASPTVRRSPGNCPSCWSGPVSRSPSPARTCPAGTSTRPAPRRPAGCCRGSASVAAPPSTGC
ncbi:polysaccharide deacetylase family protein [Micromonospora sp. 4G55]|uniref:polysaccharide deacetylase family protein n=1 Tax=Micromonospora sp. 4G55 TaxID=2806102 RepID=UPI001A4ADE84|nr:polysaccharide deacetylase family protein [Micromonospora sp. 4G55]MBM0256188.1 polysaccharide deacetylase family protein [Micromonospora sp. 4G55]